MRFRALVRARVGPWREIAELLEGAVECGDLHAHVRDVRCGRRP